MKKIYFFIFLLLSIITLNSCINMVFRAMGITDKESKYYMMSNGEKTFAYIPMHHVGTQEFYTSVKHQVDSFQNLGYFVFYEKVSPKGIDSTAMITYRKKFRKIMGLASTQYFDTVNNLFAGKIKYTGKEKLVNQPDYPSLGVNMSNAENVDVELNTIIDAYEKKYGEIILDDCDLNTDLQSEYNCTTLPKKSMQKFLYEFAIEMRDEHIFQNIINSKYDKIVIIYGRKHFKGVKKKLQAHDARWKEI